MASVREVYSSLNDQQIWQLRIAIDDIRRDLESLRSVFNAHVHGGVTTGAANSGASTTTVPVLRTRE